MTTITTPTATFTKFAGTWAIRVPAEHATVGTTVTIRKRSGETKLATITSIIRKFDDNAICDFQEAGSRRAPRRTAGSTGWSRYRRTVRQCPGCGEEEGAMYNRGRCDECGYHG